MAITVVGGFAVYSGYASMNEYLVLGMQRAGARLSLQPHDLDMDGCSDELLRIWANSPPHVDGPVLYASWVRADLECFTGTELFIRSMYEASRLPSGWAQRFNAGRAIIVPTPYVADTFRLSGVIVPIEVVPDGVDPAAYPLLDRPAREGITTLVVSAVYNRVYQLPGIADRKHLPQAIAAWQQAFAGDPTARLLLKCAHGERDDFPDDPRIELVSAGERTRGIAHWYQEADVLLALGSEGFGLPLIEGMATGLPVIALASEGQGQICREVPDLVLGVQPAGNRTCTRAASRPEFGACPRLTRSPRNCAGWPGTATKRPRWAGLHLPGCTRTETSGRTGRPCWTSSRRIPGSAAGCGTRACRGSRCPRRG